ncbi:MAG TPA: hypothetical protein PK625_07220, partial [Spirochaetales bacterium]|nr:hypothetical protein [Spirochaetales bacterium]
MLRTIAQAVDGLVVKAVKTWDMFQPGDRVLLGASGGKDSAVLAHDLAMKKAQGRLDADILAVHVRTD